MKTITILKRKHEFVLDNYIMNFSFEGIWAWSFKDCFSLFAAPIEVPCVLASVWVSAFPCSLQSALQFIFLSLKARCSWLFSSFGSFSVWVFFHVHLWSSSLFNVLFFSPPMPFSVFQVWHLFSESTSYLLAILLWLLCSKPSFLFVTVM